VGALLQQEALEPALQEQAVEIVHKIQGTELFSLLENSIENASQKIARLLDKGMSIDTDSGSSTMRNKGFDGFDIGEFV
ncbi:MAG TPA: conjugal transfer protein TraD, partial [Agriterribacter sp.]|nr:conjugal transfer protein TraD [Agriterribacter sp.]